MRFWEGAQSGQKGKLNIQVLEKKLFMGKCCMIKHRALFLGTFFFLLLFKYRYILVISTNTVCNRYINF